jgi:transposase
MFRRGGWAVLVKRVAKYEVPGKDGPTVLGVPVPKTLFPRGLLHSSSVAHVIVQKFGLGVPHHRLEQHLEGQGVSLDRSTMCRYTDELVALSVRPSSAPCGRTRSKTPA